MTAEEDIAQMQGAIDTAVLVLWSLTGAQFGMCPRLARPCPSGRGESWMPGWSWWVGTAADWVSDPCVCGPTCRVGGPGVVHLPGPVYEVTAVTVDGVALAEDAYVLEGDRLYAVSGRWPNQDLSKPAGMAGTWTVEYLSGLEPPAGADTMVGLLALEFWNACNGGKCQLPKNVQSVARQGVSIKMKDAERLFKDRCTGVRLIDMWISAINPHQLVAPASVSSPDYPGGVF